MSNFLTQLNFLNQGKVAHPNNMASLLMGGQSMTGMNKDDYMQSLKVILPGIFDRKFSEFILNMVFMCSNLLFRIKLKIKCTLK